MSIDVPFADDWGYLALRLLFVGLIYLFIWRVMRVTFADLKASAGAPVAKRKAGRGALVMIDAAESTIPEGTSFPLRAKTTVGRHPDCTIVIEEPFVSAFHAEITMRKGVWLVSDLGSTNGTFVRGDRTLAPTDVRPGDVVQFGRVKLQLTA